MRDQAPPDERILEDDDEPRTQRGRVHRRDDGKRAGWVGRCHAACLNHLEAPAEKRRSPEADREREQDRDGERGGREPPSPPPARLEARPLYACAENLILQVARSLWAV